MVQLSRYALLALALLACHEDPPVERHYPMRAPVHAPPPAPAPAPEATSTAEAQTTEAPKPVRERPKPDPAIEAMLTLIHDSGLRFIDQADGPDSRASEYTAEQFASMLRNKWDWIGYDITQPDVFIEEIATRSFKSNLPYLVVQDGRSVELRTWLTQQQGKTTP